MDVLVLYTKEQVAEGWGISVEWFDKAVTARSIPFTRIGRLIRFTEEHLRQIIDDGEVVPQRLPRLDELRQRRLVRGSS